MELQRQLETMRQSFGILQSRVKELELKCFGMEAQDVKDTQQLHEQQADAEKESAAVKQKALGHQHQRLERVLSKRADELLKHLNLWPNAPDSPANELPDLASDSHSSDARPTDLPANWPPSTPTKDSSPNDMSPGDLPPDARDENSGQKTNSSSSVELQGIVTPSPDCPVRSSSLKVSLKAHGASLDGPESGESG